MIDSNTYPKRYIEDVHTTESEKNSEWYLKRNIDYWISTLVIERPYISTFRNYYNGIRNEKEFEYLSEQFDLGTPSKLMFTPIIKPRIDALLGQIEADKYTYNVVPIGDRIIDAMMEEKRAKIIKDTQAALDSFMNRIKQLGDKLELSSLEETLDDINDKYRSNFLTDYEIAAQAVLKYFSESPTIEMREKLRQLAVDILVTGEGHYRVYVNKIGADPVLEIIKPENMFYNKNTNTQFLDAYAVVHREFLTDKEILTKYGRMLNSEQIKTIFGESSRERGGVILRSGATIEEDARVSGEGRNTVTSQYSGSMLNTTAVYHVEWLAYNKIPIDEDTLDYKTVEGQFGKIKYGERMDRYEGVRIGTSVYVNAGKSTYPTRSRETPHVTKLSYNSIFYNDRNGIPYSIVGAMKDLQDLYDITTFYRDTLVASSGVQGDRINIAAIPKVLGGNFMDRLFKFIKIKKMGYELIDPTEPGAQYFNNYGSFDNSVNGNSLQSLNGILTMIENQANIIAGTSPQMLAQIAERDAVGNVRQGLKQSLMINLDLFNLVRSGIKMISTDMLANAQIAYKKGKKISYIAGNRSYVYSILPEKFTDVDYSIYISYSLEDSSKLDNLRMIAEKLIDPRQGGVSADILVKAIMTDSATEAVRVISNGIKDSKKENDQLQQAMNQLQELQKQLGQMQTQLNATDKELKKSENAVNQFKQRELDIKERALNYKYSTDNKEIDRKTKKDNEELSIKDELVGLEKAQLFLGNGPETKPNQSIAK